MIGVFEEAGVDLHHARVEATLVGRQRVPCRNPCWTLAELSARRQQARLDLAGIDAVAPLIPALIEAAAVLVDKAARRLMRRMAGTRGEVQHERLIGRRCAEIFHEQDRLVGEIFGEVIALFRSGRRIDLMVVEHEVGVELIGLAGHEAIEPLEAAPERPTVAWAAHGHFGCRREVPLTNSKRCVTVAHEHL